MSAGPPVWETIVYGKGIIGRSAARGLYANIRAKRERIADGSGERMRKPGSKGAPTEKAFKDSAKTAKK
jgi:prephenate dehydrogenase